MEGSARCLQCVSRNNPLGLLPAFELHENEIYRALVKQFGVGKTYILSAG